MIASFWYFEMNERIAFSCSAVEFVADCCTRRSASETKNFGTRTVTDWLTVMSHERLRCILADHDLSEFIEVDIHRELPLARAGSDMGYGPHSPAQPSDQQYRHDNQSEPCGDASSRFAFIIDHE